MAYSRAFVASARPAPEIPSLDHAQARAALVGAAQSTQRAGLNRGTSGNLSVRVPGGLLITPTGIAYDRLAPAQVVRLASDGTPAPGQLRPSSEWRFHRDILHARPDVHAIVHTHSAHATALACLREDLPAFHYMVAAGGGADVRCAAYATFGTQELSDTVLAALDGRRACLMANHGAIALGDDLDGALALALELETLCQQYLLARAAGRPRLLDAAEMNEVAQRFADYGRQHPETGSSSTGESA